MADRGPLILPTPSLEIDLTIYPFTEWRFHLTSFGRYRPSLVPLYVSAPPPSVYRSSPQSSLTLYSTKSHVAS